MPVLHGQRVPGPRKGGRLAQLLDVLDIQSHLHEPPSAPTPRRAHPRHLCHRRLVRRAYAIEVGAGWRGEIEGESAKGHERGGGRIYDERRPAAAPQGQNPFVLVLLFEKTSPSVG